MGKFKRAWIVEMNQEKEDTNKKRNFLLGAKLLHDLEYLAGIFEDLGLDDAVLEKHVVPLETLYDVMSQSSASLVFLHMYLKYMPQIAAQDGGLQIICEDRDLVNDVLAHRDKGIAKEYMRMASNKKTDIMTELRKQQLFDERALNSSNVPLPVAILYAVRLSNKAKIS